MNSRLSKWCSENKIVSEYQAAYKKDTGCQDHIFVLNTIIQKTIYKQNRKLFTLFVDLSSAYHLVSHKKLWSKLKNAGISEKFIRIIQKIYTNAKAKIRTWQGESNFFQIQRGVLQGESLSATLFTIFLDDLVNTMNNSNIPALYVGKLNIHLLLYADDICLFSTNIIHLQEKINVLKDYFERNKLKVNLTKTKIVIFRQRKSLKCKPILLWGEEEIEVVDSYTYLGVPFYGHYETTKQADFFIQKGKIALSNLFSVFFKSKMKTFKSRNMLFDSLVRSVIMYCSHLWGLASYKDLEIFQMNFLRQLFQVPTWVPKAMLRLELLIKPIQASLIKNSLSYLLHIVKKPKNSLVSQCYEEQKSMITIKNTWLYQLETILKNNEVSMALHYNMWGETSTKEIKTLIRKTIRIFEDKIIQNDIIYMNKPSSGLNKFSPLKENFWFFKTHILPQSYLNTSVQWSVTRLMFQFKIFNNHITPTGKSMKLGAIANLYKPNICKLCPLCGKYTEDLIHIVFICPQILQILQRTILKKL